MTEEFDDEQDHDHDVDDGTVENDVNNDDDDDDDIPDEWRDDGEIHIVKRCQPAAQVAVNIPFITKFIFCNSIILFKTMLFWETALTRERK